LPELPESESVVLSIRPHIWGKRIEDFYVLGKNAPEVDSTKVVGSVIHHVERIGKYIIFKLDDGYLVSHLRMTGQWEFRNEQVTPSKHLRWGFKIADTAEGEGGVLWFKDVRKFGTLVWVNSLYEYGPISKLGVDGLRLEEPKQMFSIILAAQKSRRPIKNFLLDQKVIAGAGNIYATEVLYAAGVDPRTVTKDLPEADIIKICHLLCRMFKHSIFLGGCTISDHVGGSYQDMLQVYGREGLPCHTCDSKIVKILQAGRGTFYCPRCQGEEENEVY